MINQITNYSHSAYNTQIIRPVFQGRTDSIQKYIQPVNEKHLPLLDIIADFFKGAAEILQKQYKQLSTESGSLHVQNIAKPIPQAQMKTYDNKTLTIRLGKYSTEKKKIDLCRFELSDKNKPKTFDIVLTDTIGSPKKGDIFSYTYHRADKHPIQESEAADVNIILEKYGTGIQKVLRKYQKKLS